MPARRPPDRVSQAYPVDRISVGNPGQNGQNYNGAYITGKSGRRPRARRSVNRTAGTSSTIDKPHELARVRCGSAAARPGSEMIRAYSRNLGPLIRAGRKRSVWGNQPRYIACPPPSAVGPRALIRNCMRHQSEPLSARHPRPVHCAQNAWEDIAASVGANRAVRRGGSRFRTWPKSLHRLIINSY